MDSILYDTLSLEPNGSNDIHGCRPAGKTRHGRLSQTTDTRFSSLPLWLGLLLFSFLIQLVANYDSPLHTYYRKLDCAWFFMGGKALMNGFIPYSDFADSKGSLVWLFYGIGYLISPKSFIGVYVLHAILYSFIFYWAYRTAFELFASTADIAKRKWMSVSTSLLLALPFFTYGHIEMRCEDLCQLPLIYCIYRLIRCVRDPESSTDFKSAVIMGVSIACTLMIKWNIAVLMSAIPLSILVMAYRHKLPTKSLTAGTAIGFVAVIVPIVIAFALVGGLRTFVNEYFFHTAQTFSSSLTESISNYLRELHEALTSRGLIGFATMFVPLYFFHSFGRRKYLPVMCGLVMFLGLTYRCGFGYYHSGYVAWMVFLSALIVKAIFSIGICHNKTVTAAIALCTSAVLSAYVIRNHRNWIWNDETKPFIEMESKLSGLEKPTILNWEYFEYAVGTSAETLPACRYWAEQTNAQSFSRGPQLAAVKARIPDIITVQSHDAGIIHPDKQSTLDSLNYQYIGSVADLFGLSCNIYIKEELTPLLNHMPH